LPSTGATGQASATVTANGFAGGPYSVTAIAAGVPAATFPLTNLAGTISGTVFQDINVNGVQVTAYSTLGGPDAPEPGLAGQTGFLDLDGSGVPKPGDPMAVTDANGSFQFTIQSSGTYTVRPDLIGGLPPNPDTSPQSTAALLTFLDNQHTILAGMLLDTPDGGSYHVSLTTGRIITGYNFAEVPTSITVPLTPPPTGPFPEQGNANADYLEALYWAILDRNTYRAGLAYWTSQLNSGALSRLQVAEGIRYSQEHFKNEVMEYYWTFLG
jgi:hypothetical protein